MRMIGRGQPAPFRARQIVCLLTVIAASASTALAATVHRTHSVRSWTDRDGLEKGYISAIAQDHEGYLWLGTSSGLLRFDGVRFTSWKVEPDLPEGPVSALVVARDGSLWLGFDDRNVVARIRGRHAAIYALNGSTSTTFVRALIADRKGVIWAAGYGGLWKFSDDQWESIGTRTGLPEGTIDAISEDRNGDLWVGSVAGIFRKTSGADHFELVQASSHLIMPIRSFSADPDGSMWIADPQGVANIGRSGAFRRLPRALGTAVELLHDRHGALWVGTFGQGVIKTLPAATSSSVLTWQFRRREGLSHDEVRCMFEDREGNIWVGSRSGLSRLSEGIFSAAVDMPQDEGAVHAVTTTTDGKVWVSSPGGLNALSQQLWKRYGKADGLPSDTVLALYADKNGGLWLTTDHGVGRLSPAGRFSRLPLPTNIHKLNGIAINSEGDVWLSDASMGVFLWRDGRLRSLEDLTGRTPANSIHVDRRGRVWIGLRGGGVLMHQDGRFRSFGAADGLAQGTVNAIHEDGTGAIWIATAEGISTLRDEHFSTYDSDMFKNVAAVMSDDDGYLWLGIASGVIRVHGSELDKLAATPAHPINFRLFTASDGIAGVRMGPTFWPNATRDARGWIWFATDEGVAIIDPRAVDDGSNIAPPLRIESVIADDREYDPSVQSSLPPLTSKIQISYTALMFTAPEKIRFRFRLEGFDKDWTNAGAQRQAFYTNLPPRRYRFHVDAYEEGAVNKSSVVWEFSVAPAFYQTSWFLGVCAMLVGLSTAAVWRMRTHALRRRFSLVMAERVRMSRDIHDTLLQGLVGALVQFDAIAKQMDSAPEAAKARLQRARRQVEEYVRETRQSIGGLRSTSLEHVALSERLRDIGERLTAETTVQFQLTVVGEPDRLDPRRDEQLLKIGHQAIQNAVSHAQATTIRVELRYERDRVELLVSDNGLGFDPTRTDGEGWGLTSMRERAEQIGGTFAIVSTYGGGTRVEVAVHNSNPPLDS